MFEAFGSALTIETTLEGLFLIGLGCVVAFICGRGAVDHIARLILQTELQQFAHPIKSSRHWLMPFPKREPYEPASNGRTHGPF